MSEQAINQLDDEKKQLVLDSLFFYKMSSEERLQKIAEMTYDRDEPEHLSDERRHIMSKVKSLQEIIELINCS
jgi:hypothetical protein